MTNIHSPINYASRPGAVVGHIDQVLGLKGHHISNIMQFSGKHKISIGYFMYFNFIFLHQILKWYNLIYKYFLTFLCVFIFENYS